ncbi:putative 2-methoxy-6-polyprenyl-1,4-benzoquinol methylase [Helianthus annuus]|nr:putative 2-methoxy-6-polyprenyl-1,4-benzoquinol methylase [Helianthus annuus]
MDGYTIAFGIRNVTHIEKVLAEAYRYDYYSFLVIPVLGELVAGDRDCYQYLVESVWRFPPQEVFASMIVDARFQKVEYENLVGGVAAIHSGFII